MKPYRCLLLSWASFWVLLCSFSILCQTATACPYMFSGPTSFTVAAGGSQSQTWTVTSETGTGAATISITAGSDVFTIDRSHINIPGTFTITFKPGANATGTFNGTLTTSPCDNPIELVGIVTSLGVANSFPSNVSITITPNPGTDNFYILTNGTRTSEIRIYDLLGKEIASTKLTRWKWNSSGIEPGSYIVRVSGVSFDGDPFITSRRIIIER